MQAITTKYLSATNVRGTRVKATCPAGSVTLSWDDRLNTERNHILAARTLAEKLQWSGIWIGGGIRDGGFVFVCNDVTHSPVFSV